MRRNVPCFVVALILLFLPSHMAAAPFPARSVETVHLVEVRAPDLEHHVGELALARDDGKITVAARVGDLGVLYSDDRGLGALSSLGIPFEIVVEDVQPADIYLVTKSAEPVGERVADYSEILTERDSYYLVRPDPRDPQRVYFLPAKVRLPASSSRGLPLVLADRSPEARPELTLSFNPAIQAIADSVSQSRLFTELSGLSGEHEVTVGGEPVTLLTRTSLSPMAHVAAQYLKEKYEALGLETEYAYSGLLSALRSVVFPIDNQRGWAVGGERAIIHTDDGGASWSEQMFSGTIAYYDISMLNATRGIIVGEVGTVLFTTDGQTWSEAPPLTAENLRSVVLVDSLIGYCCGASGTILKTEDGGATWDSLLSGTGNDLKGVYFADPSEGWVVGNGGVILHTADSGSTWIPVTSPVTSNLNNLYGIGHGFLWACGAGGTVVFTNDGSNWQTGTNPVTRTLLSICFADTSNGWACGRNGAIVASTDGGSTWSDFSFGGSAYWDITFVDRDEGWLVGYVPIGSTQAELMHTTTGGTSWIDQSGSVESGYRNVVATKPGTTDPDEIYIIGGHYDSLSEDVLNYAPGADDDGTGTIAALEAARVLKDYYFEATIKFMGFAAEERGLLGSNAYAAQARQRGDSILAVVNFDMIGYADALPEELELAHDTPSTWLADLFESVAAMYVPALAVRKDFDPNAAGSDHWSFWQYGYVAIEGIEDRPLVNPNWHRTTDRVSTIDFDFYTNGVKAGAAVMAEMARIDTTASSVPAFIGPAAWRISPNPCRGEAEILMAARSEAPFKIEFFDVRGRLVSSVAVAEGSHRVSWESRGFSGSSLSPGVYFARSSAGGSVAKIVVLR